MGSWNTLHFFDHNLFVEEVIPALKGTGNSIKEDYKAFSRKFRTGSIIDFSEEELENYLTKGIEAIHSIANEFNNDFSSHLVYDTINTKDQRSYLDEHPFYYEFNAFFEYYVFSICADYLPHLPLRKYGLASRIGFNNRSVVAEILGNLDNMNNFHCADGNGIVNWITHEHVQLLWISKKDFILKNEDKDFYSSFLQMLEIAQNKGLGLIRGIELREDALEELSSYKLVSKEE